MKVVLLVPDKIACIAEIDGSLSGMQKIVGGYIDVIYPFEKEEVCIVINDEGKINGLPLNRALRDDEGKVCDIIAGTAFLCDCSGESFDSLSDEQLQRYEKRFHYPEMFFKVGDGEMQAFPYYPDVR